MFEPKIIRILFIFIGLTINQISGQSTSSSAAISDDCQVYSRSNWNAAPPTRALTNLAKVKHIFVHHTDDGNDTCSDFNTCISRVKSRQNYSKMFKKWYDIAWNFLIGGDGMVYEGVGWKKQGFHTRNWNNRSLGVAFIGNFETQDVPDSMLEALESLINCGVNKSYISWNYSLHGHRDVQSIGTKCPGTALYNQLPAFYNFSAGPF